MKAALLAATTCLVAHAEDSPTCLGLGACPDFPAPYADGVYPTEYNYTGEFPEGFVWGLGTASYQVEGAYNEDGRGASIWDTFTGANTIGMAGNICEEMPCPINENMQDKGATGNVACDSYHRYEEDAQMMADMGLKHYRFSVAWPRIVPTGQIADGVNEAGLQYYDNLIDALLARGITPYITLYHWDLPQALLNSANGTYGWYSTDARGQPDGQIIPHFVDFADLCFARYGDRVKTWLTFNEAWTFLYLGSGNGKAPSTEEYGDITTFPYIGAHNVLLAHAHVVDLYRSTYQKAQGGVIGMTNNIDWREPKTADPQDVGAAERCNEFWLGWFADPVWLGDYPDAMKQLVGDRLPAFSDDEKALLKGSADFFGMNHYGTGFVTSSDQPEFTECYGTVDEEGLPNAQSAWLYGAGWGVRKLLNWVKDRYGNPDVFLTEGGWSLEADTAEEAQHDLQRAAYYANYTSEVLKAIKEDGAAVKGYFAWSLMDNFEWEMGYVERFGVVFNDFSFGTDGNASANVDAQPTAAGQVRTLKDTACWFQQGLWKDNTLRDPAAVQCASSGSDDGGSGSGDDDGCPTPPWGQCGGSGYSGATCCPAGYQCVFDNEWYSGCDLETLCYVEQYGQCGGWDILGQPWPEASQCCPDGFECSFQSYFYSQCLPSETDNSTSTCAGAYEQCGGQGFDGPDCCTAGYSCVVDPANPDDFSGCQPVKVCTNGPYGQCGGLDADGSPWTDQHTTCCTDGFQCQYQSQFYSQCCPTGGCK